MPAPLPAATGTAPRRRRRWWPWVVGICLTPFVVVGLMAFSFLTLDADAAALRRHVMRASGAEWDTKFQASVGGITLGGLRTVAGWVEAPEMARVRLALGALSRASVGVYSRARAEGNGTAADLLGATDRAMAARGWSRLIGVVGEPESVLVYVPKAGSTADALDLCLAVVGPRELVVVSGRVQAEALGELIVQNLPADLKNRLPAPARLAQR